MEVFQAGKAQGGQLKVVGGEEGVGPPFVEGLGHRRGDGHPVQAAGAPAHLVQEDQAVLGGLLEDQGHLFHLHHEGALPPRQVVGGPDAGIDAVQEGQGGLLGGHKAPHLGQEGDEGRLAQIGGLARHVGPGDQDQLVGHLQVVGHELRPPFHHGVAPGADLEAVAEAGPHVAVAHGHLGQGGIDVQLGQNPGRLPEGLGLPLGPFPHLQKDLLLPAADQGLEAVDLPLLLLHLRQGVALPVLEGLDGAVLLGHPLVVGPGHLQVVAEDGVVAHLEGGDARPLSFTLLKLQEVGHPLPVGRP